ncbi:hypothetical protein AVV41_gp139 [Microcystis phage MaMV-DC]|uniref:Uncharacterized protein n=1 Tax=Microcystis phage MaMV-DC TaxID=1357715 RepID=A0A075BU84_9CAUD|nr:hypothetical protein AVV41_gp139 [Microcystis phage MaMV-DC]AGR48704.1 hypothetical protein MaMVDC_139 [Microcystis phage MaMV-DC]
MRTITSMKMINCNGWAPRTIKWALDKWNAPIPITNPLIANRNGLYYNFHTYNARGVARFYYNLLLTYYYFYEDN